MRNNILTALILGVLVANGVDAQRVRSSLDEGWRFARFGKQADGSQMDEPSGLEKIKFDDSAWRALNVPHDWGIEGPFRQELRGYTGKLPWQGIGWYRKTFELSVEEQGQRIFVDIDGAMANAKIWLNGSYVGEWPYGYTSFQMDLTDHVKFGEKNVLAIRLDTENWGSRWYPGAGIYRHVWLTKTHPVHIEKWGVQVLTPEISSKAGAVVINATVSSNLKQAGKVQLRSSLYEYGTNATLGEQVAQTPMVDLVVPANGQAVATLSTTVKSPKWWSLNDPQRYLVRTEVYANGKKIDSYEQPFGFRTLEFTTHDGFRLNGERLPIKGVCMHNDLGPLGVAFNYRAFERQMEIMKEMGVNAIRTSHHAPAPEVLEVCDRMGLLVQVESFDCWRKGKKRNDYARLFDEWHERDLSAIVKMARNNPSVFMWCLGNEILEKKDDLLPVGIELAGKLDAIVKKYDTTRPTTVGMNRGQLAFTGFQNQIDIFGFNYNVELYQQFHKHEGNEKRSYHGSETSSCISSRGEYFFPVFTNFQQKASAGMGNFSKNGKKKDSIEYGAGQDFQMSSYDIAAPGWGCTPDYQFMIMEKNPECLGEFVWTGFDYLGEPTPYNADMSNLLNFSDAKKIEKLKKELESMGKIPTPSRSSYFGIVDLCGLKKDRFYLYQSHWRPELPMAHILPHWNWPGRVGKVTPVHVYTSGDEAELFLNGKSLGRKKKAQFEYRLMWNDVIYAPGTLKVVAYLDGKKWAEDSVETSGSPATVELEADRSTIYADGQDLCFVTVSILDASGKPVPRSHNEIEFSIEGSGEIVAIGNGDAASLESIHDLKHHAFNGQCMVIIRAKEGKEGRITLKAKSEKLVGHEVDISSWPVRK